MRILAGIGAGLQAAIVRAADALDRFTWAAHRPYNTGMTIPALRCPRCRTEWPCQAATAAVERIAARHPKGDLP